MSRGAFFITRKSNCFPAVSRRSGTSTVARPEHGGEEVMDGTRGRDRYGRLGGQKRRAELHKRKTTAHDDHATPTVMGAPTGATDSASDAKIGQCRHAFASKLRAFPGRAGW